MDGITKDDEMFNEKPRKTFIPTLNHLRKKVMQLQNCNNEKLKFAFLNWFENNLIGWQIFQGDIDRICYAEVLSGYRNVITKKRPHYEYHKKSKAWRIERNYAHGGTPWRAECFATEKECIEFIEKNNLISDY
jgi:hypothetical protein